MRHIVVKGRMVYHDLLAWRTLAFIGYITGEWERLERRHCLGGAPIASVVVGGLLARRECVPSDVDQHERRVTCPGPRTTKRRRARRSSAQRRPRSAPAASLPWASKR